jgi:hypothetical protein
MNEAVNPYAAPAARVEDVGQDSEAERIRWAHISHEASIKAVGLLDYLGGGMVTLSGLVMLIGAAKDPGGAAVMMLLFVAIGAAVIFVGWGVRALKPWARIASCILSAIGLLGFPLGTIINGYILYLLLSKKGNTVFSPEYQAVVAATPHVKYKTSIVVWICLALILGLILIGVLASIFGK